MKILLSGSTGFLGTTLLRHLSQKGYTVHRLMRGMVSDPVREVYWKPSKGELNPDRIDQFNTIIHLAGSSIAGGRWTAGRRKLILESRTQTTELISRKLAGLTNKPSCFLCASAVGYYGDCGDTPLDESSPNGDGFLSDVCRQWEEATLPAKEAGIRVVNMRFGVILGKHGGLLEQLKMPFKLGLGAKLGNGKQFQSWVSLEDVVRAIEFLIEKENVSGAVNITSPSPVQNTHFTRILAKKMNRPAVFTLPAPMLRLILGQLAEEMLLASQHALPTKLQKAGFRFNHPTLAETLDELLY
ncbi:TIGR01777 family oxidoreductase [bacterium]|nr:TIGR01777 family oxidoreductase [bacterium]